LVKTGELSKWEYEPKTFYFEGENRGAVNYTPDFFLVWADGRQEYHEVKGYMTDKSASQLRKMSKFFPSVRLVLIGKSEYSDIRRRWHKALPGWE
jgi:hypothetical protein